MEEKKVGKFRGFFENLSAKKEEPVVEKVSPPPAAPTTSLSPLAATVDERMVHYLHMSPEASLGSDPDTGRVLYSYQELVRRNYVKDYSGGVVQVELEEHLSESEFLVRFNMTKVRASPPLCHNLSFLGTVQRVAEVEENRKKEKPHVVLVTLPISSLLYFSLD